MPATARLAPPGTASWLPMAGAKIHARLLLRRPPHGALADVRYIGGVLHGLLERPWFPAVRAQGEQPAPAAYRLLAPPAQAHGPVDWWQGQNALTFSALWFGDSQHTTAMAAALLQGVRVLSLGAQRHELAGVETRIEPWLAPWPVAGASAACETPAELHVPGPARTLLIEWLTPLDMVSEKRIQAGEGQRPPYLHRILRSLERRALLREPQWAQAWGLCSDGWKAAMEHLWVAQGPAPQLVHDTFPFSWPYGSRTKDRVLRKHGLLGSQTFHLPLSPAQEALLTIGTSLGVGEGASLGCGRFSYRFV